MVRRAGGGIGNVSVSQDVQSLPGKICLRISQHALKPDSQGIADICKMGKKEVD